MIIAGVAGCDRSADMFTKLIAAGVAVFLGMQAIVNIGGVIRMLPMTGFPSISSQGVSLITSF